jgi:predicted phage tail protein
MDIPECYNRIPKSVVKIDLEVRSINKWQREWDQTIKGKITKDYFLSVAERLKMK